MTDTDQPGNQVDCGRAQGWLPTGEAGTHRVAVEYVANGPPHPPHLIEKGHKQARPAASSPAASRPPVNDGSVNPLRPQPARQAVCCRLEPGSASPPCLLSCLCDAKLSSPSPPPPAVPRVTSTALLLLLLLLLLGLLGLGLLALPLPSTGASSDVTRWRTATPQSSSPSVNPLSSSSSSPAAPSSRPPHDTQCRHLLPPRRRNSCCLTDCKTHRRKLIAIWLQQLAGMPQDAACRDAAAALRCKVLKAATRSG